MPTNESNTAIRQLLIRLITALVCFGVFSNGLADSRRQTMADAMLRMMEAMGMLDMDVTGMAGGALSGPLGSWEQFAQDISPAPGMFNQPGSPTNMPDWTSLPSDMGLNSQDDTETARILNRLAGPWLGRAGEQLYIRDNRFILQAGPGRLARGHLFIRGKLLGFRSRDHEGSWVFEFKEHQGRLVLRDKAGQIFLFRKMNNPGVDAGGRVRR